MHIERRFFLMILVAFALCACGDDDTFQADTAVDVMIGPDGCPVDADVIITDDIDIDTTWTCPDYLLQGAVFVTNGATLTIEPGVSIYGDAGSPQSGLIVTRGSSIDARGTATEPIVFTSGNADGDRATGDWAGLALLGAATINNGADADGVLEGRLEGLDATDPRALFGGSDDASSCGTLEYVRIEFAGAELSPDNELNGLTVGGCGSGTTISHVQVHRGKDDGIEFFGGTAGMDHVVITGASDDSLDFDLGWRGNVQFLVVHQFPGVGDNGIEGDNLGSNERATPRTRPTIFNATFIGTPDTRGMVLREGALGTLRNFIITDFGSEAVDLRAAEVDLATDWPASLSIENSFFFNNGDDTEEVGERDDDGGFLEGDAIADTARANVFDVDPMIPDVSSTTPSYVPSNAALMGQATPPSGFDPNGTYAGAFEPGGDDWTIGWTAYPLN